MDFYIGEIQIFGFNFAPRDWANCNGDLIPIQQASTLFSLLGITYGGNGSTHFGLPNLRDRAVCGVGLGPGLTERTHGAPFGNAQETLTLAQLPQHSHALNVYSQNDASKRAMVPLTGSAMAPPADNATRPYVTAPPNTTMATNMLLPATGGGQPHNNMQPYLSLNFCIALIGTFPARP